jgi:Zn-dependent protease
LILKFSPLTHSSLIIAISLNVTLAVFNLLPIPPLDGAKILLGFLPTNLAITVEESLSQYGTILLIFLIFPFFGGSSLISYLIFPIIDFITNLLL